MFILCGWIYPFSNVIDFVNIATTGNATDFNDATASKRSGTGYCFQQLEVYLQEKYPLAVVS